MSNFQLAIMYDTFANRPAAGPAGNQGRLYCTSDTGHIYRDNGATWDDITSIVFTAIAARLVSASNLSDLANAATARTNLGLGTAATQNTGAFDAAGAAAAVQALANLRANNLSDVANAGTARANLGLGALATLGIPIRHGCQISNSANIAIADNTEVALTFDTEIDDTDGYHSLVSNTDQIVIPAGLGGVYTVTGMAYFFASDLGYRDVYFKVNGTIFGLSARAPAGLTVSSDGFTITNTMKLAAGDVVQLFAYQNSGGSVNIQFQAGWSPYLSAYLISQ